GEPPKRSRHIDAAVEQPPSGASQALDHALRRGDGKRDEQHEREHAHRDEGPLEDILSHAFPGKEVVETYPDGEVDTDVEEGQEAEESPELDRPGPAEQDAQRGDAEAGEKQDEGGEP